MFTQLSAQKLSCHMAANPLNLPGVNGYPPLDNWNFYRAKYQREGRANPNGANPYAARPDSMAAVNFAAGQAQALAGCIA